jgi:hypothetical protein
LRLGDDARDHVIPELFECIDLGVRPTLRFGRRGGPAGLARTRRRSRGKSCILAWTVGESASQIDTGFDQGADVDKTAELRSDQKRA